MQQADHTKYFVVGASGMLGRNVTQYLVQQNRSVTGTFFNHSIDLPGAACVALDLNDCGALRSLIQAQAPDVVVYSAGLSNVDLCERDVAASDFLNAKVPGLMAAHCADLGIRFVHISTDHLWDGESPYRREQDPPHPINAYARSKAKGEAEVADASADALIVRTNFFGPGLSWHPSISDWMVDKLRQGGTIDAFVDSYFTPIHMDFLSATILDLVAHRASGIFNVASKDRISKFEFAQKLAQTLGIGADRVRAIRIAEANLNAPRPYDMSLSTDKVTEFLCRPMPTVDDGIKALSLTPTPTDVEANVHTR